MRPDKAPAAKAARVASTGCQPVTSAVAATAPPRGKLPSTVRSGKLMTRNEMNTPSATSAKIKPISSAPAKAITVMAGPAWISR